MKQGRGRCYFFLFCLPGIKCGSVTSFFSASRVLNVGVLLLSFLPPEY